MAPKAAPCLSRARWRPDMRLAHLSDVHVLDLKGVHWTRFLNKRISGLVNLRSSRKDAHPQQLLEVAVAELVADRSIDHVVISGDLTNLSLESEFTRAKEILAPLAGRVSVIPGNHDVYTRGAEKARRFEQFFGEWMWPAHEVAHGAYPWLKQLDEVALLGFSSAVARMPLFASGRVSRSQLERLEQLHAEGALEGRMVVAMVHHNLHPRGFRKDKMRGLDDREVFLAALAKAGVKLLLHGHTHVAHRFEHSGISIIGSGSSTWSSTHPLHMGRYNVYDLGRDGLRSVEVRRWHAPDARFVA